MNEFKIGGFAVAAAGHDTGKCYVIFYMDNEYIYLVDGKIRTTDRPKKKKKLHVKLLTHYDQSLADKINHHSIKDEEIKRAIKLFTANSGKEVKNV
jgi:ribosomal protein L14E/L6E/L27E